MGTAKVLTLKSHMAALTRYRSSAVGVQPGMQLSASALEQGGAVIGDAKSIILQGLNGTLSDADRQSLAAELKLQLDQLLDIANTTLGGKHLFSGTKVSGEAYALNGASQKSGYSYQGTEAASSVEIGNNVRTETLLSGQEAFGKFEYSGVSFAGLTGLGKGIRANEGVGFEEVILRHDSTIGAPGAGVTLANGGADNTILGAHTLTIDGVNGTVTLDGGGPLAIPQPGDANYTDFVVTNQDGAEVHLDFSGYAGGSNTAALTGEGSISIDGATFTPLTLAETDLQLIDGRSGAVLHVDTTQVTRAGVELVGFDGAANVFDALKGAISDLENGQGLKADEMAARLEMRLGEIDRNHENMLQSISVLGSRLSRIEAALGTLDSMETELASHLSSVQDADLASVVTDATQAEQTMQLAQMAGSRLMQNSLLNFLR
jgi:flagellar hook-associated protein 3 FlgL